jgi:hypothetical protein
MAKKVARKQVVQAVEPEQTAVIEEEIAPVEPEQWKMPKPCRGETVIFYYGCSMSKNNEDIAFITSVEDRQVSLAFRSVGYADVYHVDDPRLVDNPDLRNSIDGVWEFTSEKLKLYARLEEIEQRIASLEQ